MDDKLDGMSMDIENDAKEKLKSVFPQCFAEGKLDIDKLLNLCGEYITNDYEKYKFEWKGKAECFQIAAKRTTGTLRPCIEESVNFDETQNLYIEGDNLEVLKILQRAYFNKVKMIYIDPPYNTGNDFVYEDDFKDPIQHYKEVTSQATKSNPEKMGRFHTAWLNMMFPRLRLAYNLLREDGVCFISIDDHEVHNLRKICDEVFGEENFVTNFVWEKGKEGGNDSHLMRSHYDNILCYCKDYNRKEIINLDDKDTSRHINYDKEKNLVKGIEHEINSGEMFQLINLSKQKDYKVTIPLLDGTTITWQSYAPQRTINNWIKIGKLFVGEKRVPYVKSYLKDELQGQKPSNILNQDYGTTKSGSIQIREIFGDKNIFNYPKPSKLIKRLLSIGTSKDCIVLDFFSGSATTAHAVMELNKEDGGNRKFIMVQLPELCDEKSEAFKAGYKNICEIGKERIRRAGTRLSEKGKVSNEQLNLKTTPNYSPLTTNCLDIGFKVFKLDSSNLKAWDSSPVSNSEDGVAELIRRLEDSVDRRKPDRTDLDMVYEVMLKLGIAPTESVTKVEFDGKVAYSVREDCLLLVCLDKNLETETVDKMSELAPAYIVFGQECFEDVSSMSNAKLLLKRKKIDMKFV